MFEFNIDNNIRCPFCGIHYSISDSKNVSRSLIYFKELDNSHSCINVKDLNIDNYPGYLNMNHISSQAETKINNQFLNIINSHKECFILYMCRCPNCFKIYSFICILNRKRFPQKLPLDPFVNYIYKTINIVPNSPKKFHFPKYIPSNIIEDYNEAYQILHISPQSTAMLVRKILEEIIVDRFNIPDKKKGIYIPLSKKLKDLNGRTNISYNVIETLYAIKTIGDAGAHKKSHEDQIIHVSEETAADLLKLIYDFIYEAYVDKHEKSKLRHTVQYRAESISHKYAKHVKNGNK